MDASLFKVCWTSRYSANSTNFENYMLLFAAYMILIFMRRLIIQVLTVRRLLGGYTMLKTEPWRQDLSQQWDAEKVPTAFSKILSTF